MSRTLLAEGKTKRIWDIGGGLVEVESKDDITAGDGARHDMMTGKAELATQTAVNCFKLLEYYGISNHFRSCVQTKTFTAVRVDMIPLELVARRVATGSYLKRRPDVTEGTIFGDLIVEFFEKDDAEHDPLVIFDLASQRFLRFKAGVPLSEGFIGEQAMEGSRFSNLTGSWILSLIVVTRRVFEALERAWAEQEVTLVDLKIEFGISHFTRELLVADVIDNDSWRIWPGGKKEDMKDKQVYRNLDAELDPAAKAKELGKIKENYGWVARATNAFRTLGSR